jgi:glycosyltransferase involved in cell wall biosynthesis
MPLAAHTGSSGRQQQPVILYVINSFDRGGAEAGLVALVKGGLFANCQLKIAALVRGAGGLELQLSEVGNGPEILLDRERMRLRDMPRILLRLRRFIEQAQPNIVIGSLPQANLLARLCMLFKREITFISFEHNSHLAKRVYESACRLSSWRVDWLFADARSTMEMAGKRLYRRIPARQTIVPLVSFDSAASRSRSSLPQKPFRLVNAARFTSAKNQAAIIEAAAILIRSDKDVTLTLYGDGPEREACEALAARLGIGPCVHFAGFVQDWPQRPADLFVLASKHEGLCIVALEAMHAGIPVLAPLIGGLRDYADPDIMQVLPSLEPRTIAGAIVTLMNDNAGCQTMVRTAAEMVDRRFGVKVMRKIYAETNQVLIEQAERTSPHGPAADSRSAQWAHTSGRLE